MNKLKVAKELVRLAKEIIAIDVTVKNNGETGGYDLTDRYWELSN